jgi:hypothetical protein
MREVMTLKATMPGLGGSSRPAGRSYFLFILSDTYSYIWDAFPHLSPISAGPFRPIEAQRTGGRGPVALPSSDENLQLCAEFPAWSMQSPFY